MKAKIIILGFAVVVMSSCAVEPISVAGSNGQQRYTINCDSGIDKCHKKSVELCSDGYDIVEHEKKSFERVIHYGQHPVIVNTESLTIDCKSIR